MSTVVEAVPVDLARQSEVTRELRAFMPDSAVLFDAEDVRPYECDGLSAYRQVPMVVALPQNESEIERILAICHRLRVPVVARGAGTGLSGGALPRGDGVLLSTAKLMGILEIDPIARTARVQPGVRNLAISEAASPYGLYYAPDPSSQIACTIGGNVA
jgi:glycolate oxidase